MINTSVWQIKDSFQGEDFSWGYQKILRFDVSSTHPHSTREKNAVTLTLASKLEWYSKDTDHWTIKSDSTGVSMILVSRDAEERERAINVRNAVFHSLGMK